MISVEDFINQARISPERFVLSSEEELLKTVRKDGTKNQETEQVLNQEEELHENIQEWKEKLLYGPFVRQTEDQRYETSWTWLNGLLRER